MKTAAVDTMHARDAGRASATSLPRGVLQRQCACGGSGGFSGACPDCRRKKLLGKPLQAKLRISEPGDHYEQEADRVAEQVMRMPDGVMDGGRGNSATPLVQRRAMGGGTGMMAAPLIVHDVLNSAGQPLDGATRAFFEPRFGHDFSQVRVHADGKAEESARAVNAHAYTVGTDIVFGNGQYVSGSSKGRRLLAHELTHVIQQSSDLLGRQPHMDVSHPTTTGEVETGRVPYQAPVRHTGVREAAPTVLRRQPAEERALDDAPGPPLTRSEEIALSQTLPGGISVKVAPPMVSLHNYAINSPDPKPEHKEVLGELRHLLGKLKVNDPQVTILGHADETGDARHNERLSVRRAAAVRKALQGSARSTATGLGEHAPVVPNDTVAGRSRNRRVDIYLLSSRPSRRPEVTEPPKTTPPPAPTEGPPTGGQPDVPRPPVPIREPRSPEPPGGTRPPESTKPPHTEPPHRRETE